MAEHERELLGTLKVERDIHPDTFTLLIGQRDHQPSLYYLALGDLRRLQTELQALIRKA
jgi:hypothetical protein